MSHSHRLAAQQGLDQAQALLHADCPHLARQQIEQAIRRCPDIAQGRLLLAQTLTQLQRYDESMRTLDVMAQQEPTWHRAAEVRYLRAINLLNLNQAALAWELAQGLMDEHPLDLRFAWLSWNIQAVLQNSEESLKTIRTILRLTPDDPTANRLYAQMLEKNDPRQAAEIYLHLAERDAHRDAVLGLRAVVSLMRTGQLAQAAGSLSRLLVNHPQDVDLLHQAALLADELGDDAQACRRLRQALQQRPSGQLWLDMARVHLHAGRLVQAAGSFFKASRMPAVVDRALAGLLVCAVAGHRGRLAMRLHQRLVRLVPNQTDRQRLLHGLWPHWVSGRLTGGVIERSPADSSAVMPTTLEHLLAGAREVLQEHARLFPQRADVHYHLAQCQAALGQRALADVCVQRALSINPRYQMARRLRFAISRWVGQAGKTAANSGDMASQAA